MGRKRKSDRELTEKQYQKFAVLLEEYGHVYIQRPHYARVVISSKDIMLIDRLIRYCGYTHRAAGRGVKTWRWAHQKEMSKMLPHMIPYMSTVEAKNLYSTLYRWAVAHGPSKRRMLNRICKLTSREPVFKSDIALKN